MKTYPEKTELLIEKIIELTKSQYTNDNSMLSGVIGLTVDLKLAEQNNDFIHGMLGFINWCQEHDESDGFLLTNLIHDLGEFSRNGNKSWFSPRTSNYIKFALVYTE